MCACVMFCVHMYSMSTQLGGHEGMLQTSQALIFHLFCNQPLTFFYNICHIFMLNWQVSGHTSTVFVCSTSSTATFKLFIYTHLAECLFI